MEEKVMPRKLKFFLAFAGFLFIWTSAACLQKTVGSENSTESLQPVATPKIFPSVNNNSALPAKAKESSGELSCSPTDLKPGDILTLKMKPPHGGYLEVITPKKKYIFLSELDGDQLVKDAEKAGALPFYAASEFAKLAELKINMNEATTIDYEKNAINGKKQLSKIFSVNGKYKILLSKDSFETDDPTITGQCEVYYTNVNQ